MSLSASIIVRTKNEARSLGAVLELVFSQSHSPHEVIVIDSGSTDATVDIANRFPVRVLHIHPDEWSYPLSLNRAASVAKGEILVCLSAHCLPVDRNWLEALCAPFDDPDVAAVWGPSLRQGRPLSDPGPPILQQPGSYGFENRTWGLSNANSALRRPLWEQFPFDERLQAAEDKAWGMEAMSRGFTIAHQPRAAVWHEGHTVRNAYLRNRKVAEGFSMIFPDAQDSNSGTVGRVGAAGTRSLLFNFRNPHPVTIWRDLRRVPSTVAAVVGAYVGYRG